MSIISQRLTEKQKREDDFRAAKDLVNSLVPAFSFGMSWIEEYNNDLSNYRLVNNIIDQDEFKKVCNPLGIPDVFYEDELLPYNKIPTKISLTLGEELGRNETYAVGLLDSFSVMDKEIEWEDNFRRYITNEVEKIQMEASLRQDGLPEDEIDDQLKKFESQYGTEDVANYLSSLEIFANSVLRYAMYANDLKTKKNDGFNHALISAKEIIYVGIENGKPEFRPVNPLYFIGQKGPEIKYFEDGDYAGVRTVMTLNEVMRKYGNKLSEKDLERLKTWGAGKKGHLPQQKMDYHFEDDFSLKHQHMFSEYIDSNVGSYGPGRTNVYTEDYLVWVTHFTWKWQRKVGFLTVYDEFGEADTTIVDDSFEVPYHEVVKYTNKWGFEGKKLVWYDEFELKHEIEWLWVPRVWEATRIENDIFVDVREVPYQPVSFNDPFTCKLPYHGTVYYSTNAKAVSAVSRMKPFQFLYFVAMQQFMKLLARNYGKVIEIDTTQIDPNIAGANGSMEEATEITMAYLRQGIHLFNSLKNAETQTDVMISRQATKVKDYSNTIDLINLVQILAWLDQQIGMGFGISPERESQFSSNSNVTDNKQSIIQSSNITEIYFYLHNEIWKNVMEYYVNMFRIWAKDRLEKDDKEKFTLHYVLPNGTSSLLSITPDMVKHGDLGLFVKNFGKADDYFATMIELGLTFVQNGHADLRDISQIMKAKIDGISPEELHKMIEVMQKKRDQREQEMQEAQSEAANRAYDLEMRKKERDHEMEIEKIKEKGNQDRLTEAIKTTDPV